MIPDLTVIFWFSHKKIVDDYSRSGIMRIVWEIDKMIESYSKNPNDVTDIIESLKYGKKYLTNKLLLGV